MRQGHTYSKIHSVNFLPEQTGVGKYHGEMAAWLMQSHEVCEVDAPHCWPKLEIDAD
jgi:colanic acid biosynthesis glycosyl transferase WcaI